MIVLVFVDVNENFDVKYKKLKPMNIDENLYER